MKKYAFVASVLAVAAGASGLAAAAGRAMTIADLITAVRVTEPALSPDGQTVAFVRTTTNGETGKRNADIWVVPSDGASSSKLLIGGESSELTPTYAPDGKRLAFISTRAGAPQVFVAAADGSSPTQITKLAMGVQTPLVFSPDGLRVAFVSDVYPECPDEACNARACGRSREESGQGAPRQAAALPSLVGLARGAAASRLRDGHRNGTHG
jgi:dipeptidyl aminopeptidase/acylaminoacyl peptidase